MNMKLLVGAADSERSVISHRHSVAGNAGIASSPYIEGRSEGMKRRLLSLVWLWQQLPCWGYGAVNPYPRDSTK